jgi:phage terminase large subunit
MYCLGTYYNKAILAVETNYSTHPVRELERLGYDQLYVRERVDTYTHRPTESYGFVTNGKTRPIILAELVAHARDHMDRFCDKTTLEEMLTFVRNEKGRPEASAGAHDDCIMALTIALHAREQMVDAVQEAVYNTDNWTEDMWDDYHNADEEGKAYLLSKWA